MSYRKVVKCTFITYRNQEVTEEQFLEHWTKVHAAALLPVMKKWGVLEYKQQHTTLAHRQKFTSVFGEGSLIDCDGVTTMVFPDWVSLEGFMVDPENQKQIARDLKYIDVANCKMAVGNEVVLIEDGKLKGGVQAVL